MLNKTAAVTLVSNPSPTVSTYEWVATNVRSMNRTNKLSSAPFYVPNPISRKHQFRLVLLRGVVRGETPEKDPIAIYLEYLPPSPPLTDGAPIEHPNHCKVAVWCVNVASVRKHTKENDGPRDVDNQERENEREEEDDDGTVASLSRGAPHRYEETTFTFTATDRMAGFKEIVPHTDLDEESVGFLDPNAFNALTIRVEITTGIVSVADVVAKTTDRWATSFWGSATSALAAIQTGLDVLKSQVINTIDERQEGGEGGNATSELQRLLPWEELPAAWGKASRSLAEWEKLITITIVEDDGTFLFGPDRGLHADEQVLMTQLGLNHRAIMNASAVFDYDRDVHEGLLTATTIRKQRYNLVPKHISDKKFWANYMWKVASLSIAPKNDQIHLLLSIVNAPPRVTADNTKNKRGTTANTGGGNNGSFSSAAAATRAGTGGGVDQSEARADNNITDYDEYSQNNDSVSSIVAASVPLLLSFLEQLELDVAKAVKAAVEAVELLEDLVADEADELLISSALQSCEGCNAKLRDVSTRVGQNMKKLNQQQARAEKSPQQHQQVRMTLADSNFSERHASLLQGVDATSERLRTAVAAAKGEPKTTVVAPTSTEKEEHDSHPRGAASSLSSSSATGKKEPTTGTSTPSSFASANEAREVKEDSEGEKETKQEASALEEEEKQEEEEEDEEEARRVGGPSVGVVEKLSDADTISALVEEGGAAAAAVGTAISSAFSGFFSSTIAPPFASSSVATSANPTAASTEGLLTAENEVPRPTTSEDRVVISTAIVDKEGTTSLGEGDDGGGALGEMGANSPQIGEQEQEEETSAEESAEATTEGMATALSTAVDTSLSARNEGEEEVLGASEGPAVEEQGEVEGNGEVQDEGREGSTSKKSSSSSNDAVEISADEATAHKSDGEFVVVGSGAGASSSNRDEAHMRSTTINDQRVSSTSTVPAPKKEEAKTSAAAASNTATTTKEGAKKGPLGFLDDDDFLDAFATSSSPSPKGKTAAAKAASPLGGSSSAESTTAKKIAFEPMPWEDDDD